MEQKQMSSSGFNPKEKNSPLQSLISKLNKAEPSTFGNYYVNFNEMFKNENDYKDYLKNHVSLFNDELVNREKYSGPVSSFLQSKFFDNFHESTLFYIFYYLTRDTLQLFAGVHLYKKGWKYNYKYQIWFKEIKDKDGNEKWEFFNPLEWKKNEFIYGPVDTKSFLTEEEAKNYLRQFENDNNKKDKKKQGQKSSSSSSSSSGQNNNAGGSNNQQNIKQTSNNANA